MINCDIIFCGFCFIEFYVFVCKIIKVPESVVDKRSGAYNKERVFIHGASESTANAYKHQFQTDLAGFLRARSQEMKRGGSMFLVCLGRTSVDPTDQGGAGLLFGTHYQDAWDDLVQEVIIIIIYYYYYYYLLAHISSRMPLADQKAIRHHAGEDMIMCRAYKALIMKCHWS